MSDYNELKAVEIAERYQGALTSMRIVEIGSEELPARFSLMYLKTLHAKIFQDFPKAWFAEDVASVFLDLPAEYLEFSPGEFRTQAELYSPWTKLRSYEKTTVHTYYSCAQPDDFAVVEEWLASLDIKRLQSASLQQKKDTLVNTYEILDFLHPFQDGNSRTIRLFIGKLAEAINLPFSWDNIKIRDLYAARDLNLLTRSKDYFAGFGEIQSYIQDGLQALEYRNSLSLQEILERNDSFNNTGIRQIVANPFDSNVIELLLPGKEMNLHMLLNRHVEKAEPHVLFNLEKQLGLLLDALEGDVKAQQKLSPSAASLMLQMTGKEKEALKAQCFTWKPEIEAAHITAMKRADNVLNTPEEAAKKARDSSRGYSF